MPEQPKRKRGRGADPEETKRTLVAAATASVIEDGYRGTTARSIGARADCNQAAIYYHFGGIDELLIEALKASSAERLGRYSDVLRDDCKLQELVADLSELHAEDRESGHLALLAELSGGITASPELRQGIEEVTRPWVDFVEARIAAASASLPFGQLVPARDLADIIFCLVIGVEVRNKIDGGEDRSDRLFRLAGLGAALVDAGAVSG